MFGKGEIIMKRVIKTASAILLALAMTTPGDTTMASKKEVEAIMGGAGARVQIVHTLVLAERVNVIL